MKIAGKVHCFFEQSGVFKNEFKKLGYEALDYDIQNAFNETDNVMDLFAEIEKGYNNEPSLFDTITKDDLIIAFFPCIYFTGSTNPCYFTLENINYRCMTLDQKLTAIVQRANDRHYFYLLIIKLVGVCLRKGLRLVFENPYSATHYLHNNFFKAPTIIDKNRMKRGDYFVKPTGYWFFNCEPTYGESYQNDKEQKKVWECKGAAQAGICSTERSLISPDYARNWICDFIIGKEQAGLSEINLFSTNEEENP